MKLIGKYWLKPRSSIVLSACLLVFIDSIGLGLVFPILPSLFLNTSYGLVTTLGAQYINILYGVAIAIFPLASLLGMPILGSMSDKIGRKKVLLLGVSGLTSGYALSIVALLTHDVWLFFLARFLSGFSSGTYSVCSASIIDISLTEEEKINGLKYLTLANVAGFIMGPALAIFVHQSADSLSLAIPFIIATAASFLNFLMLYAVFPTNLLKSAPVLISKGESVSFRLQEMIASIKFIFKLKPHLLLLGYLFFNLGFEVFLQSQSIHLSEVYGYNANKIGAFFVIMGLVLTFSMFFMQPKIYSRYSLGSQIKAGLLLIGLTLLTYLVFSVSFLNIPPYGIFIVWSNSLIFYALTPFITLNMTKIFSDIVSKERQGNLMGSLGQLSSLATVFGALVMSGLLYIGNGLSSGVAGGLILVSFMFIVPALKNLTGK